MPTETAGTSTMLACKVRFWETTIVQRDPSTSSPAANAHTGAMMNAGRISRRICGERYSSSLWNCQLAISPPRNA
ncbi:MAG: hypothetical protein QM765_24835 [Myxococcales bacterium]